MTTLINLIESQPQPQAVEILQLYQDLELLRLGRPPQHTLFVLGRTESDVEHSGEKSVQAPAASHRLLLVDPPADLDTHFRVEGDVAMLLSRTPDSHQPLYGAARLSTEPGGTAHIRLGEHFLDLYSQQFYTIVHFPALGIVYSGEFGSEVQLPRLAAGDNGEDALESVRLLAALVKSRPVRLLIPHTGELEQDVVPIMERLAADVAYLHNLRRTVPALPAGTDPNRLQEIAQTLLPRSRQSADAASINLHNVQTMYQTVHPTL